METFPSIFYCTDIRIYFYHTDINAPMKEEKENKYEI